MNTQQKDLSHFRLRLQELVNTSFPEKANDQKFIDQRSSWAANAYKGALHSGNTIEKCHEIADYILFENLHFSKFDTIFQVVCNEFDTLMADEKLRPFALKMFSVCKPVFAKYKLTDDFAYTYEFDKLYSEITEAIAIWIEENGLS
ncbi:hypothetical protein AS589_08115 [Empedobacter brevis]|uniref:DUF1896 domain-containing protein n=1 Tax=Empedobacter brevis TaxID=247 RepID=UPI0013203B50|nr:DUF1896 domain-containing protein [Empedobacter brevis]QHC86634.1 hypothetical protein AS589_08115 [Empedobacter brevis]